MGRGARSNNRHPAKPRPLSCSVSGRRTSAPRRDGGRHHAQRISACEQCPRLPSQDLGRAFASAQWLLSPAWYPPRPPGRSGRHRATQEKWTGWRCDASLLDPLGSSCRAYQVLPEPGSRALGAILQKAGTRQGVVLTWVDDELRGNAERAKREIHLLASDDGYIEVLVTTHEQGRGANPVRMQQRIGQFHIQSGVAPRIAQLLVILDVVLIYGIRAERIGGAGATECRPEALVRSNRVIGQHSAIAPASDSELLRVGNSLLDQVVHAGDEILDFFVSPVGKDCAGEGITSSAAAAIVDAEDHKPVCGKQLAFELIPVKCKRVLVLQVRTPVYPQYGGISAAPLEIGRLDHEAMNWRSICAFETHVLGCTDLQLSHEGIVVPGKPPQVFAFQRIHLGG